MDSYVKALHVQELLNGLISGDHNIMHSSEDPLAALPDGTSAMWSTLP